MEKQALVWNVLVTLPDENSYAAGLLLWRFMKHLTWVFLFILVAGVSVGAAERKLTLTAEKATGGVVVTFADGAKGIALDKTCEAEGKKPVIEWKLDQSLQPGWWRGTLEFGPREGDDRGWVNYHLGVVAAGGREPMVDVMANFKFQEKGSPPYRFEFWIYISEASPALRLVPVYDDLWRYKRTWPVTHISLESVTKPKLTEQDAVTADVVINNEGLAGLPEVLPAGNWSLRGAMTKAGAATIHLENGKTITAPFSFDRWRRPMTIWFYAEKAVWKTTFKSSAMIRAAVLSHLAAKPAASLATEGQPITVVDPGKVESETLELIGAGLTGEGPVFPLIPHGKSFAVLTTWDDGAPPDLRLAELLRKHGFHGSFFMNQNSQVMKFLDKLEALGVEVGSHCYHHPSLYAIPPQQADEECIEMRKLLEAQLKHPVISMAYPNGYTPAFDTEGDYVLRSVRKAGFWSARTTLGAAETMDSIEDLLALKTDGFFGDRKGLERAFNDVQKREGGVFHFWGHSWQIGKTDEQWQSFESFISGFAGHPNAWYASQGELSLWMWARKNVKFEVTSKSAQKVHVTVTRPWLHPYLAKQCPMTVRLPAGVTKVLWRGRELPVANGMAELTSE